MIDRFVLRAGEEWQQTSALDGVRALLCDAHQITPRYKMRSGVRYALKLDTYTGRVVLRALGPLQ